MAMIDLPPQIQERVVCSISAAVKYKIPANIVLAVAEKEAGKPGQWVKNTNGTHDVGPMQFNTSYLSDLSHFGITPDDVAQAGCYSFDLAAWRLRQHIQNDKGDLWTKASNYHSRTPQHNTVYRADLIKRADKWARWLDDRFVTYDITNKKQIKQSNIVLAQADQMNLTIKKSSPVAPHRPSLVSNTSGYVPRKLIINHQ
ncbi:MAG: transglycosylase SLT domain-containing protein [Gammaproteobacteria bacterium]